jgi:flagellar hook protein FlgE
VASASDPATALFNVGDTLTMAGSKGGRTLEPSTFTVTSTSTVSDFTNFMNGAMGVDTTVAGPPTPGASIQTVGGNSELTLVGNTGTENALTISGAALVNQSGGEPLTMVDGSDSAGDTSGATGESVHTSMVGYDSLGTPVSVDVTAVLQGKSATGTTWQFYASSPDSTNSNPADSESSVVGGGTLSFDSNGKLVASTGTNISLDRTGTGAASPLTMKLDFSNMTSLAGNPVGTLSSFSIGNDGTISGSFSNGETRTLGQVAVAMFNNPEGLQNQGSNDYIVGANSGVPIITSATQLGAGEIRSGSLELSNVDLSKEFINMIVASTGFSASSRVITTSDQLITDLLNSGR